MKFCIPSVASIQNQNLKGMIYIDMMIEQGEYVSILKWCICHMWELQIILPRS